MKTTAERLAELAVAYAKQRHALRANGTAIKQVQNDADDSYFDLKPFRDSYYLGEWLDGEAQCIVWHGWLHALDTHRQWYEPDKEQDEDCGYRATAILMDERRDILRNCALIRAAFTKIGDKLLKESTP
jgi:hypothetical protein